MITIEKADTGVAAWVLRKYQSHPKPASFDMRKLFFRVGSVRGDGRLSNPNIIKQMAQVLKGSDEENKVRYDDDKMIIDDQYEQAAFCIIQIHFAPSCESAFVARGAGHRWT